MKYLIKYTKFGVFKTTFISTLIIFCVFNNVFSKTNAMLINNKSYIYEVVDYEENKQKKVKKSIEVKENINDELQNENEEIEIKKLLNDENLIETKEENIIEEENWGIEIPIINLIAKISEGTDQSTMNKYVGHFKNTSIYNRECWISSTQ